ncbi:septation protein SepH [Pseudonocardia xishanensis]|uniref:DUF3071 domain-containing protein n=1 Tax=Pseudonocardia xishanensis TaxID=630995 RepID=A0ABP8RE97_9PSEU
MRSLRVVGIAEDGAVVLEDSVRRERYTVPADEQLRAAARGDLTRLGQIAIELESQLRPREIQARIRAGASVDQVAAAAGVPTAKIERFAYPVLLERARTADLARAAHPVREDGPDLRTLEETVAHTFGVRGQDHADADWDSWKGEDGKWVVSLGWRSGKSDIHAHWTFQPGAHGGTVTALDDHARDLVEGLPQQPLRPVGPVIDMARAEEPEAPAPAAESESVPAAVNGDSGRAPIAPEQRRAGGSARTTARTRTEARAETAPTHPATRTSDTRATQNTEADSPRGKTAGAAVGRAQAPRPEQAAPEAARDADTSPEPGRSGGTRREQARPAAEAPAPTEQPTTEQPATEQPTTEQPAEEPKQPAKPRAKKGKPVMPSWDEVLLGVRGR